MRPDFSKPWTSVVLTLKFRSDGRTEFLTLNRSIAEGFFAVDDDEVFDVTRITYWGEK